MNERQLDIFSFCETYLFDHENPTLVSKYARYFREGYDAFGLDELQLKKLRDMVLDRWDPDVHELAELGGHFLATGKYEFGSLAILLLKKHRPRFDREVFDNVRRWLDQGVENWAHADLISNKITPVFLELGVAGLDDFRAWLDSPSKWTRRVAAVTMLYLKETAPVQELLDFVLPLLTDEKRTVQQGVGWLLRELWKLHPEEVEEFLLANKDSVARLIVQYATEKMAKERKKLFRSSKPDHKRKNNQNKQKKPQKPEDDLDLDHIFTEEDDYE
jgi:3-methyladenine DNA glycosylase AlkD